MLIAGSPPISLSFILTPRKSLETTGAIQFLTHSTIPMLQWLRLMLQSKSKVLLLNAWLQKGTDSNIKALILIDITVAAVIVIAIVVVMMGEFAGDCGCARCLRT